MFEMIAVVVGAAISASAPIIYASLGETISQRSGVMNLDLEGVMLVGAIVGYKTATETGSLAAAMLMVVLSGALLGLLYAFLTVTMRTNQPVTGLAFVMVGEGLSGMLGKTVNAMANFGSFEKNGIPGLQSIPVIGTMRSDRICSSTRSICWFRF